MAAVRRREGVKRKGGRLFYIISERHNCTWEQALEIGLKIAGQVPASHFGWELKVRNGDRGKRHDIDVHFRLTE